MPHRRRADSFQRGIQDIQCVGRSCGSRPARAGDCAGFRLSGFGMPRSSELISNQLAKNVGSSIKTTAVDFCRVTITFCRTIDGLLDCIRKPSLHVISFFSDFVSRHFIRSSRHSFGCGCINSANYISQDPFRLMMSISYQHTAASVHHSLHPEIYHHGNVDLDINVSRNITWKKNIPSPLLLRVVVGITLHRSALVHPLYVVK